MPAIGATGTGAGGADVGAHGDAMPAGGQRLIGNREVEQYVGAGLQIEHPEVAARLRGLAEDYLASPQPWGEAETLEVDEIQLNQLRALGYQVP